MLPGSDNTIKKTNLQMSKIQLSYGTNNQQDQTSKGINNTQSSRRFQSDLWMDTQSIKSLWFVVVSLSLFAIAFAFTVIVEETPSSSEGNLTLHGIAKHVSFMKIETDLSKNETLFLSPYIKEGKLEEARKLSRVSGLFNPDKESYSGFLNIDEKYNTNIFFWFFPAENGNTSAPLILWVEGGPGQSSFFSVFEQTGPYRVIENEEIIPRNKCWSKIYNMLYIDQPIGVGYSFTDDERGYANSLWEIGDHMQRFLLEFLKLFPQYRKSDFYPIGLSFGGKSGPILGKIIIERNAKATNAEEMINFKGVILADGVADILHMSNVDDYYYQTGLVDKSTSNQIKKLFSMAEQLITENEDYVTARKLTNRANEIAEDLSGYTSSSLADPIISGDKKTQYFSKYVRHDFVKKALHIGNLRPLPTWIAARTDDEYLVTVQPGIEYILQHGYKVLSYVGQYDLILINQKMAEFLDDLNWPGATGWEGATRNKWYLEGQLVGYVKSYDKLTYALVIGTGHVIARDKPDVIWDLITKYLNGSDIA